MIVVARSGAVLALVLAAAEAAYGQASENFNAGLPAGWTADAAVGGVGWAVDGTPGKFPSGISRGGTSLNYNNGTSYDNTAANTGSVTSGSITVPATRPALRFWCNYATETRGAGFDTRTVTIRNGADTLTLASWQLASTGYSFTASPTNYVNNGPGPCSESYTDLETGVPVGSWHRHRIYLDPAWASIRVRFTFNSIDNQQNGYAGWAIDDLDVSTMPYATYAGWPDTFPDLPTGPSTADGDGAELDICQRLANDILQFSWGCNNQGNAGIHMLIGNDPLATPTQASILDASSMFFDPNHNHYHMSQYSDFSLWQAQSGNFVKLRRGAKRSYCLTDIDVIGAGPSISPGCSDIFQAISYNWQDVYAIGTPGQEVNVAGLANGTYYLVGVLDPINRLRETNEANQMDQIRFNLTGTLGQVAVLDHTNPHAQVTSALSITTATAGTFGGNPAVQVVGTGFDSALTPIMYGSNGTVTEAPFYTVVTLTSPATEIWVTIPPGSMVQPVSIDLLRADGRSVSARVTGSAPAVTAPANDMFANRITIAATSASGTNLGATAEASEPNPAAVSGTNSVWWQWTSTVTGSISINTTGSNFDTTLGVYTGTGFPLTLVGENDDNAGSLQSLVTFSAITGTNYIILVNGFGTASGNALVNITNPSGAPLNDAFASAFPLLGSVVSTTGTNVNATGEAGEPNHAGTSAPLTSVWWTWTAPGNGSTTISTIGSSYDTTLGVYTGSPVNSLILVASNDDILFPSNLLSSVTFTAVAGTTYRIAVAGWGGGSGNITLNVNGPLPPPSPFTLTGKGDATTGISLTPTFTWAAATGATSYTLQVATDVGFTALVINQASIAGTSFTPGSPLAYNTPYYWRVIAVSGSGSTTASNAPYSFTTIPPPPPGAFALSLPANASTGVGLTPTYSWTPSSNVSTYTLEVATDVGFTAIVVNLTGITGTSNTPATTLVNSTLYYWRVTAVNVSGSVTPTAFSFTTVAAPPNDNFANSIALVGTSVSATGTNSGATAEGGEPNPMGSSGTASVWWSWTAPSSGNFSIDTFGSGFNTTLGVYTGTVVSALTLTGENNDAGGAQSQVVFAATVGTVYHILVNGFSTFRGSIMLSIGPVVPPPPPAYIPGANDVGLCGSIGIDLMLPLALLWLSRRRRK